MKTIALSALAALMLSVPAVADSHSDRAQKIFEQIAAEDGTASGFTR